MKRDIKHTNRDLQNHFSVPASIHNTEFAAVWRVRAPRPSSVFFLLQFWLKHIRLDVYLNWKKDSQSKAYVNIGLHRKSEAFLIKPMLDSSVKMDTYSNCFRTLLRIKSSNLWEGVAI